MAELVKTSLSDGVLHLVIDRTDKKNSLTEAMYATLTDGLAKAEEIGCRAVLFRSEGEIFTAGNDMGDFAATARGEPNGPGAWPFLHALARSTRPLIAAAQGRAVGIGATMLLHCDYVLLAEGAELITGYVRVRASGYGQGRSSSV